MLRAEDLHAAYGAVAALSGVTFQVDRGEVLCLVGRNGAGKTTALKAVMGLVEATRGRVLLDGVALNEMPAHQVPGHGVGYVPQGRRLFSDLTVAENLEIGLMTRRRGRAVRDRVLSLFPRLGNRLGQRAGTLSGGEQQMLAIGRALCLEPEVLLLDEPTEGLQPSIVAQIQEVIGTLSADGTAIALVEQRLQAIRALADRVTFIENGQSRETLAGDEIAARQDLLQRYVGVGA